MTIPLRQALADAHARLAEAGLPSPSADAQLLLTHVLGVPRGELSRRIVLGEELDDATTGAYRDLVARRARRFPLQHLTGTAPFRRLELQVGPGVFVPRAETELVAGIAIDALQDVEDPLVVDLCTGSGAIAFAVADEVPSARVVAVELDPQAVAWARRNLEHLGLAGRVDVRLGDASTPGEVTELLGAVDVVTANPPYIPPDAEPVEPEVRDHDPALALYGGGDDGLAVARDVLDTAAALLRPGGLFVMEHGDRQGPAARQLLGAATWTGVRTERDLAGRDRALVATRAGGGAPAPR
jgi:release factor glutamine methyltransferase